MKDNIDKLAKKLRINRREFLKRSAQSGVVLGTAPLLTGCFNNHHSKSSSINKEQRTYYFDLSHTDKGHKHYLIKGSEMLELDICTSLHIEQSNNPLLQSIPEGKITHHITHDFPKDTIQACYIQTINPNDPKGVWGMSLSFFHLPSASVQRAATREESSLESSPKLAYYGLDSSVFNGMELHNSYLYEDDIKAFTDHAIDLTFHHPEILSGESDSATHIQKNIISIQPTTIELALRLKQQGTATETGGWATMEPYIHKDTGEVYLNSNGQKQYFPRYSATTNTYLGNTINPSLESVKNDVTLGVNITNLDPNVENVEMTGKLWKINNGITTVKSNLESETGSNWLTCSNKSRSHGYKASLLNSNRSTRKVTLLIENWFVRYLGIYVQFLDSDGNKIPLTQITFPETSFAEGDSRFDGVYSKNAAMVSSEFEILGIPIKHTRKNISFIWPEEASSAIIIAGGLGTGGEKYEKTLGPAVSCTIMINLAVPALFLSLGAMVGFTSFASDLESFENIELATFILEVIFEIGIDFTEIFSEGADPELLIEVAKTVGEFLLFKGISWGFVQLMNKNLEDGEILDAIPVVGKILAVVAAAGLVAELAQTIAEVTNSPANYSNILTATHDIEVTIKHDPADTAGFPAVADYYTLTAMFDNATPHISDNISMPSTTVTDPIKYTFNNVPYGGNVNITVGFYSNTDGWLAGIGSTENITNNVDSTEITIKEILVPLNSHTKYGHKQKIVLDKDGKHVWETSSEAPSEKVTSLACEDGKGNLCNLIGITISENYGTLGYSWKSDSEDVSSCESGGSGQLNQFATASFTQDPQTSYTKPSCGFSTPVRIIYDLMSSKNNNYYLDTKNGNNHIRQVRLKLNGQPSIDRSDSNICWGKFNNPSDALLLHPSRKLISINTALNKIEILELPEKATTDDKAPLAVSYSGRGIRHGLVSGPVAAAISPQGVILILESKNKRVQAFDTGMNPTLYFKKINYHFKLKDETEIVHYTDMAMEYTGYIYILSYTASYEYRLDIYNESGDFISRTTGMNADKLTVDLWRNIYALNYEVLKMPDSSQPNVTEPSISQWVPSIP